MHLIAKPQQPSLASQQTIQPKGPAIYVMQSFMNNEQAHEILSSQSPKRLQHNMIIIRNIIIINNKPMMLSPDWFGTEL